MKNLNTKQLEEMLENVIANRKKLIKSTSNIQSKIEELIGEEEMIKSQLGRYTTQMKELEHLIQSANLDENIDKFESENTSQITEDDLPF